MTDKRYIEKTIAVAAFIVAAALAFFSMAITEDHDVAANTLLAIAQFLTLCATIFGIDYKFTQILHKQNNTEPHDTQQPEINLQT